MEKTKKTLKEIITEFIFGSKEKRRLRDLGKKLTQFNNKYYKPSTKEILPEFGIFVFKIFKMLSPCEEVLMSIDSRIIKKKLLEKFLSERQNAILSKIDEDILREEVDVSSLKAVSEKLKILLKDFAKDFDRNKMLRIEGFYRVISNIISISKYDYMGFIKKCSFNILYDTNPMTINAKDLKMHEVNGRLVLDMLKDLHEALNKIDETEDWNEIFDFILSLKTFPPINIKEWNKLLKQLRNIKINNYITNLIYHIEESFDYKLIVNETKNENIVENYVISVKNRINNILLKISNEKKDNVSTNIFKTIFGANYKMVELENFNLTLKEAIERKGFSVNIKYVRTITFILNFILEIYRSSIKELQELILVRATWLNKAENKNCHMIYYKLNDSYEKIIELDNSLNFSQSLGNKIRNILNTTKKGEIATKQAEEIVNSLNEITFKIISEFVNNLIFLTNKTRVALSDYNRGKNYSLISNWKELDSIFNKKTKTILVNAYKKMYYFIKLIQNEIKPRG